MHPVGHMIVLTPEQATSRFGHDWRELLGNLLFDGFAVRPRPVSGLFACLELHSTEGVNFNDIYD